MDDDYVAEVLAREARDSSQRYQKDGLGAYLPRRPTGNAPKPNTRFLRHLIRETDSHNTALRRKEEREARERSLNLRAQPRDDSVSEPRLSTRRDHRSRDSKPDSKSGLARGHREARRHHHKREGGEDELPQRRPQVRDSSADRDRSQRHHRDESYERSREHRDRRHHRDADSRRERHGSYRKHRSGRDRSPRSRSRSPRRERSAGRHRSQIPRRRSESPSDERSSKSRRRKHQSEHFERESPRFHRESHSSTIREASDPRDRKEAPPSAGVPASKIRRDDSDDDSDPLEDLVGPLPPQIHREDAPPLRSRGRGAYKPSASTIDAHFAPNYDPALDVHSDGEGALSLNKSSRRPVAGLMTADDDWDMALEALRDRQRWKHKGEERLRAAGMNEETIDRWKNNAVFTGVDSTERNPENVRWAKKGEGREWDRGKVMDEEGNIDVRPSW